MRITELLLICGCRAGEVLTLPANPLVRELVLEDGVLRLDARTGKPVERIGLKYVPEKGGEPIVKWVPAEANPLILRSIADIEEICGPFRENARCLNKEMYRLSFGTTNCFRRRGQRKFSASLARDTLCNG